MMDNYNSMSRLTEHGPKSKLQRTDGHMGSKFTVINPTSVGTLYNLTLLLRVYSPTP